jgi:tetratricopeptide (TPR) repeat protein
MASGKTQLALDAAESLWHSHAVDVLAWVDASSRASVLAGYRHAAAAAGRDLAGTAEAAAARFVDWLSQTARPWLIVLDDLCDPADLAGLWPRGAAGRVLITTRDEGTVSTQQRMQVRPVGTFSARESLSFLLARLAADPDQRHGAIDLAAELGGEPAALVQASAVIASSRLTCHDYRDYFAQRRTRLAERAGGGQVAAAAATWTISAEQAGRLWPGQATQLLLALAAMLDGHPFPATLFTTPAACQYLAQGGAAVHPDQVWEAALTLERTGLLAIDQTAQRPLAWMSAEVAAQVRAAASAEMLDHAAQAAAGALLDSWPAGEPQPWLATSLRSCTVSLQQTAGDRLWTAEQPHPVLLHAGHSLDGARLTGPAAAYWAKLAADSDRILGPTRPVTLMAGSQLARALLAAGKADEAISWAQWAVAGHTQLLGPDHPDTLTARVSLGRSHTAAGQPGPAVTVLSEAVTEHERVLGAHHPHTLTAREELASACQAAGKPTDAIKHYRRVLTDRERVHGERDAATMAARDKLAGACLADGRAKEAIAGYRRTLADRAETLGPGHLDTIAARHNLATAYHAAGKLATAVQLYDQACTDSEQILGPDHPGTLARRADLAQAYQAVGRLADAITLMRATLARCERALPPDDPLIQSLRERMTNIAG